MKLRWGHVHIRLWLLMAGLFTIILTLTISTVILIYRIELKDRYELSLRDELREAEAALIKGGFSDAAQGEVSAHGIHLLLLDAESGTPLTQDPGLPLDSLLHRGEPGRGGNRGPRDEGSLLLGLVDETLGGVDGSFFLSDVDQAPEKNPPRSLNSKLLVLCGRKQGMVYALSLPVESTNEAIRLAIRYATLISLGAWALSLAGFYLLSKAATRPHRRIAETAAQIAELDFSQRCPEAVTLELNDLSQSINAMADSLEANVEALRGANEQLQTELNERTRQQQITTELIGCLSHDLKTPIAIISGYAEGLREGVAQTPEKQQLYYDMILRESEHMQAIVSQMLALGRMESGETPVSPERFDLTALLDEVLESFQREMERLGLALTKEGPRPCMVYTDYACVRQSLVNYIQNAVYHINNGNQIRVKLEERDRMIRVSVSNASAPIPPEELCRLWDKLYRGDPSRQRHNGEVGLGLSIVKGNMERLGHAFGCENLPGFGVEFWLELPKAEQAGA